MLAMALLASAQMPHPQPTGDIIGPAARIQPPVDGHRFAVGQSYTYNAEWRIWKAGTATLKLDAPGRVTAGADSSGFVALLFGVHDRFQANFDPRTFCSQGISKHTEEGFRKRDTQVQFDYTAKKSVLRETNLKTGEKKTEQQDIPECVTDVLSGIYYVGSLPLPLGATHVFPLNDGGKTVDVHAKPEAREQVKTDAGTFSAIKVRITASAGMLKDRGEVWIWYTDDAQRIPVQMRARMFWGTLTLKLARVENK